MARKHKLEEIIGKLREAEIVLAQGGTVADASRRIGVTEQSYYRWRKEYGGLKMDRARRMNGEIFYTLAEARILIEAWRRHYNTVRPHSSLGYRPPAPETAVPPWLPSGSATLHLRSAMAPEAVLH
jgi:transposase InsO family protein